METREPPRAVAVVVRGDEVLVIKRYLRRPSADACVKCRWEQRLDGRCPGHTYAVLPGGGVEAGETTAQAAERELAEEASLTATAGSLLWESTHRGRHASYFSMVDVRGEVSLGGEEALDHSPDNSFVLAWVRLDELDAIGLEPSDVAPRLRELLPRL